MRNSTKWRPSSKRSLPTLEQVRKEKARRRLRSFIRDAWHLVEPKAPFVDNWHIGALCEHLEAVSAGQIKRLLVNIPPRTMKSLTISVFWPAWEWASRPETRWLFASYAATLSTRDSLKCRRVIEHPWYRERWGSVFSLTTDQNVKNRYENDHAGYRIATSVDGVATGEGGDIVVVDDPHNIAEAHSDAIRESVLRWWDESMSTRLNDPREGRMVIVMQRIHMADLSGHLLAKELGWEHLCLPMEFDGLRRATSLGDCDPRQEEGELLWPQRFDGSTVEALKKSLGSYAVAGQLQQRPSPAGGGILKREHWRYYKALPEKFDEIALSFDMTFKKLSDNDFVVGQGWGRKGPDKYLLPVMIRERMGFAASCQAVRNLKGTYPRATAILVEDKANGPAVIETLTKEISGIVAVEPEGGKEARAFAIQPQQEAGNLYLPDPSIAPWVEGFVAECAAFPRGAHDDQVDACTQAILWMSNRRLPGLFTVGGRRA